jgi:hypothetical protein
MSHLPKLSLPVLLALALMACGGDKAPPGDAGAGHSGGGAVGAGGKGGGKGGHGGTSASGGAGGSTDLVQVCKNGCKTAATVCAPGGGPVAAIAESTCLSMLACDMLNTCTNKAAVLAGANVCLAKTSCNELTTCFGTVPVCAK